MSGKRKNIGKTVRRTAVCGILCALSFVLLLLGAIIEVLDFSVAILMSFPILFCLVEMGYSYAFLTYGVTSVLGLLLLPGTKFSVLLYILCAVYPILRSLFERLRKPWGWILKALFINVDAALIWFLSEWLMPESEPFKNVFIVVFWICMWIVFVLYDILLSRILILYTRYWRKRLRIKDL